jgi:hypothetical protein
MIEVPEERTLGRLTSQRVRQLLGDEVAVDSALSSRDELLRPLSAAASSVSLYRDARSSLMEAAVASSLVSLDYDPGRDLFVSMTGAHVLARDGQFARLRLLAPGLERRATLLELERPFLSVAVVAMSRQLLGRTRQARRLLQERLGLEGDHDRPRPQRTVTQLVDLSLAASLLRYMADADFAPLDEAAALAARAAEPLSLAAADLARALAISMQRSDTRRNLLATPEFADPRLAKYVDGHEGRTLFRSQLRAIEEDCLDDSSCVLALPTSAGKTLLAELRLALNRVRHPGSRAIYLAPYRLLARQVADALRSGLGTIPFS